MKYDLVNKITKTHICSRVTVHYKSGDIAPNTCSLKYLQQRYALLNHIIFNGTISKFTVRSMRSNNQSRYRCPNVDELIPLKNARTPWKLSVLLAVMCVTQIEYDCVCVVVLFLLNFVVKFENSNQIYINILFEGF